MAITDFYLGWWQDWATGDVSGWMYTVSARNGGFLISFLTLFTRVAGGHAWDIVRFVLHQSYATAEARDGLYHQKQAILRNAASQGQAIWHFILLAWAWRSNAERSKRRTIPLIIFTMIHVAAFIVAGLLTSRVVSASNDVLRIPQTCGYWPLVDVSSDTLVPGSQDLREYSAFNLNNRRSMTRSANYEGRCYEDGVGSSLCNDYTVQSIPALDNRKAPCPVSSKACREQNANIELDTQYINSNIHLGINTLPRDSVDYRKVTTCAPIDAAPWHSDFHITSSNLYPSGDVNATYLYLGVPAGVAANTTTSPVTADDLALMAFWNYSITYATQAYDMYWFESIYNDEDRSQFVPNTTFHVQVDEDVTLVTLLNAACFAEPVYDSWFLADGSYENPGRLGGILYNAQSFPGVLFCSEKHQFCNPGTGDDGPRCSTLSGRSEMKKMLTSDRGSSIGLNDVQWATTKRLLHTINEYSLSAALKHLSTSSMLALDKLDTLDYRTNCMSEQLLEQQWAEEVVNWHNTTLANLQRWAVQYVRGPIDPAEDSYIEVPETSEELRLCHQQRQRSLEAWSFNGVGVVVILSVGSLIIITNLTLPYVVGWIQDYFAWGVNRGVAWEMDETLQLQRMAYEQAGQGRWTHKDRAVPVTARGEVMIRPAHLDAHHIHTPSPPYHPYVPLTTPSQWGV